MNAVASPIPAPKETLWNRVVRAFVPSAERRSVVTSVKGNSPFSAWQQLLQSWGIDEIVLSDTTAQSIPAFNRAIEIIATQIASLPISVFERQEDGTRQEAKDDPLFQLLKYRPHPLYNSYDFRVAIIRQLMIRGNAFVKMIYAGGRLVRLEIIQERLNDIIELEGEYFYRFQNLDKPINSSELLHFKINSLDGITGQDTLEIFRTTFERALAEIKLGQLYYKNGGQVGGLLVPDQAMNPKQWEQASAVWTKKNVGRDKVGKVGMMPFGFKYVKLADNINDNKLNESRARTTEDFSNITGVNPVLLGSMTSATFSNVEELNRIFVQFTLRAYMKCLEDEFNTKCFTRSDLGRKYVRFNEAGILRGDTKARSSFYLAMRNAAAISPNEIRALENMDPYEGGDKYDLPLASNIKTEKSKEDGEA